MRKGDSGIRPFRTGSAGPDHFTEAKNVRRARRAALSVVDRVLTVYVLAGILSAASAANELSGDDIARIVGEGSSSRSGMLCRLAPQARDGLSATEVAAALGPLHGVSRAAALKCLRPKIQQGLTGADIVHIVGNETTWRHRMLCTIGENARNGTSAAEVAAALGPLAGANRVAALHCMQPRIQQGLTGEDFVQIVGNEIGNRMTMVCDLKANAREGITAAEVATALGPLTGGSRWQAIRCLEPRIQRGLTGADLAEVVGEGTAYRDTMLCTVKEHAREGITAAEVSAALGPLTGGQRWQAVRCLEPRIQANMNGLDYSEIVGQGDSHRTSIICQLKNHRAAALNAAQTELALSGLSGTQRSAAVKCLESAAAPGSTLTYAAPDPEVWIGAPFAGTWPAATDCAEAKYPSKDCSLPMKHWTPYSGDWAVDLPKPAATKVHLYVAPRVQASVVTTKVESVSQACTSGDGGKVITIGVYVEDTKVGWIKYAHVIPAVEAGAEVVPWGTELGSVFEAGSHQKNCWYGPHVHMEVDNTTHYSCYNKGWSAGQDFSPTNFFGFLGGRQVTWHPEACP